MKNYCRICNEQIQGVKTGFYYEFCDFCIFMVLEGWIELDLAFFKNFKKMN